MANNVNIMSCGAHKADHSHYPTSIAHAFHMLLGALEQHIEAEREIEDVDIWDPAFRNWLTAAENAFTGVTTQLTTISTLELTCADDRQLKRMSMLIDALIGSEQPQTFMHLYRLMPRFEQLFYCSGTGPAARHHNVLVRQALTHIDTMTTLLTYNSEIEAVAGEAPQLV